MRSRFESPSLWSALTTATLARSSGGVPGGEEIVRSCKARRVLALVALVVSVGIVDSLNPSTIGPALFLATAPDGARRLAGFTAGVLAVALAGGLVLTLGPGQAILAAVPRPGRTTTHAIELALGGVALGAIGAIGIV